MNIKEKLSKVNFSKETFKGLLTDMRNGCIVLKNAAVDLYHSQPAAMLLGALGACAATGMVAYTKGVLAGDELGRTEAAEEFGLGRAMTVKALNEMYKNGELDGVTFVPVDNMESGE